MFGDEDMDLDDLDRYEREHEAPARTETMDPENGAGALDAVAPAAGRAKPARTHVGPWPVDPDSGRAVIARSVLFPPALWALLKDLANLEERKLQPMLRHASVLYVIDRAQEDPRVVKLIYEHGLQDTLGIRLSPEG